MSRFGGIPLNTSRFGGIPVVDDLEDDVNALFDIESGYRDYDDQGNPITSPKGAMFKSQVTPATAADPGFGIAPAAEQTPEEFNRVGREYYAKMLERYDGDKNKAVAAYNAGPTAVDRALTKGDNWLAALPEETQNHVRKFNERLGTTQPDKESPGLPPHYPKSQGGVVNEVEQEKEFTDRLSDAFGKSYDHTLGFLATTRDIMSGDDDAAAEAIAMALNASDESKTPGRKKLDNAIEALNNVDRWSEFSEQLQGFIGKIPEVFPGHRAASRVVYELFRSSPEIGELAATAATNPAETAIMSAESAATTGAVLTGGGAGSVAGAAVGGVIGGAMGKSPSAAAAGARLGGSIGGRGGVASATAAVEVGAEMQSLVGDELASRKLKPTVENVKTILADEEFKSKAVQLAATKGLTLAAVDAVLMRASGAVGAAPYVKMADTGVAATLGDKAKAVGKSTAIELASEPGSELTSQGAQQVIDPTREIDRGAVAAEAIAALPTSAVMAGGSTALELLAQSARDTSPGAQLGRMLDAGVEGSQFTKSSEQVAAERFAAGTRATGGLEINTSTPADIVRSGGAVEPEKDVTGVIASQMQPSATEATVKWLSEDGIEYPVQIVRQDVPVEGDDRPHALVNYNGVEALVPTEQLSGVSATPQRGSVNFTPADSPTLEAGLQPIIIPEVTDVSIPVTPVVGSEGSSQLRSTVSLGGMGDSGSNNVVGRNLGDVPGVNATPGRQTSFVPGGAVQQPASVDGVRGQAIDNEWSSFAPESGTLSIPRTEMPQVKAEHRGAMVNFLKARGIESEQSVVPAASLKPTQAEFSEVKVQSAKDFTQGDRAILVSSDGHILDGHHQWMAKRDNGEDVRVITLNAPINELMEQVKEFPSSEFATEGVMKDGQVTPALPDSSVDGVGSQTERFRQVGQQAIDADAARRGEASPFQLTPAAPRVDQKVTQIGTALSDALGLKIPVVAFDSADPKSPHGFAVAGTAFVNVNGAVHPTPNTTLHEMKHVIEGIAQVENQMGLEGTAAQNFTRQIDSLFDEMSEEGKRSYLSNLLHTEELRALDDTDRESRIQELLVDKTGTLRSEMIADFLGNRATDRQFWRDLANQDPEGFQGFVQKWLDILDNLIDMLRGRKTANKQESSEVDNYVKDLNKAKMVVRDAMVEFRRRAKEEYPDQVMDAYRGILTDRADSKRQDRPDRKVPDNLVDTASLDNALKMAKDSHFKNIIELKDALQTAVLADAKAAKVDLRSYGPNTRDYVVKVGVKDAVTALKSNPNAIGWYDDNVTRALGVLSQIHPELSTDADAKFAFTYALAVTSNGLRVEKNFELAERAYQRYKNDDVMPSDIGIGDAASQINKGLALFNVLKAEQGIEQFRENMLAEMTVRQVQQVFDIKVAGELMDTKVRGAAILGPKIGNGFFANLNGVFDQLTMDRWLMRTFGRWTGTLLDRDPVKIRESRTRVRDAIRDLKQNPPAAKAFENAINRKLYVSDPDGIAIQVKKASMVPAKRNVMNQTPSGDELRRAGNRLAVLIDGQKEAPANGSERNFIRDAFSGILADVRQQGYENLTMADLQAVYWYAEKRLYDQARSKDDIAEGYNDDDAPDYYNAALNLAKQLGVEVSSETRDSTGSTERGADAIGPQLSRSRRQAFQDKFLPNRPGSPGNENVKAYKDPVDGLYEITDEFRQTVSDTGLTPVNLVEMPSTPESASKFEQAIRQAKTQSKFGAAVYVYPVDDYQRMRLFQSEDGLAGFAIKPDGDIVSVYSNGGGKVHSMLALAVEQGGTMLDAFDTILPELYSLNGFRETSREPWNDEYRPEGWDKAVFADYNNGEPDVVYMTYDPTYIPTEEVQDGNRGRRNQSREIAPLEGAPIIKGATGPDPRLVEVAERYAAEKGISLRRQTVYAKVDEARARRIAEAYDAMPHAPQDPRVREAYENLIRQTVDQYQALVDAGYRFWFTDLDIPSNVEYLSTPWNAMRDLRANKEMGVFPTAEGFGSSDLDVADNPLLAETGFEWPVGGLDGSMKPVLANDLFRAVHDAFGHGLEGAGFRAEGEENAWQAHVRLFTGSAVGALTSETRGQNSWLNYGPYGEQNRTAKVEDTVFADQKTGLMPEWTWTEGRVDDMPEVTESPRFSKKQPLGFYSELSNQVTKGPGSAMKDQWKGYINGLKNKGVKPDEIEWSGVMDWLDMQTGKVSRDDVLNFLDNNGVQVEEVTIGRKRSKDEMAQYVFDAPYDQLNGDDRAQVRWEIENEEPAKYAQYQLPGGENYREVLLTLPDKAEQERSAINDRFVVLADKIKAKYGERNVYDAKDKGLLSESEALELSDIDKAMASRKNRFEDNYKSPHWDQPNVVAHIRMNDRTDVDGNRVLFIEELQSDWAQEGRKKGFGSVQGFRVVEPSGQLFGEYSTRRDAEGALARAKPGSVVEVSDTTYKGVPSAPFVTATDKWVSLAIKRIITMATEGGYDKVAFVNGEQSADRYDLSHQLEELKVFNHGDGNWDVSGIKKGGGLVDIASSISEEKLADTIGKDMAKKAIDDQKERGWKTYSGLDLKVGGEGMKSFYDIIVPKVVKDVIKKVGKGQLEMVSLTIPGDKKDTLDVVDSNGDLILQTSYDSEAWAVARENPGSRVVETPQDAQPARPQPGFAITEAMRDKVDTTGLPQFSKRQTETPEFKRWFGDSKVVDENGEPLVVYHGTPDASFNEFNDEAHFTENPDYAAVYTHPSASSTNTSSKRADAPATIPVYLSIQKPFDTRDATIRRKFDREFFGKWGNGTPLSERGLPDWTDTRDLLEWMEETGQMFDGLLVDEGGTPDGGHRGLSWVPAKNTQIKSATGNRGTFDSTNPDIRFSRPQRNALNQPAPIVDWSVPEPSKMDTFIYTLQDKHVDTKRVIQAIQETGNQIQDKWDPYLQEGLFHGRSADRVAKFLDGELRPLLTEILARGETMEKVEEFLHNVHAAERNAQIAKVNPTFQGAGSGITDADAAAYLAAIPADRRQRLDALAQRVRNIIHQTQDMLVAGGLETQETINKWRAVYPNYIPLEREDVDFGMGSFGMGTGQGYSTKGSSARRATGSTRPAINIMANIAMQRERAITRVEKNRVALALYGLAVQNPNTNYWLAVNPDMKLTGTGQRALAAELVSIGLNPIDARGIIEEPKQTFIDPVTGLAVQRTNPALRSSDNVISVRINGKDRHLFFNMNDPRAERMVGALKNMDTHNLGRVLTISGMITRYISSVNTQYNPVFGVVNFTRDIQSAALNLTTTAIAGKEAAVMAHTLPALTGIYRDLRSRRAMRGATNTQWSQLWEEFTAEGGKTGFREQFRTSKDRQDALFTEMNNIHGSLPRKTFNAMFGWLSDYNEAMENAVRLSAYKVALDSGLSKQRAAMLAKNLTVNFNRKGAISQHMGSMYAFFNASVQGTQRLYETLSGPKGKMIVAGGLLLGAAQAVMLAALGFDEDEPPEFVRERNIIIPLGGEDKKYLTVPMPLGFHVIPNISRKLTESWLSGWNKPGDAILDLTGIFFDAFNPIGSAGWSLQTVMPSVVDPAIALLENKDWGGRPIYREKFGGDRDVSPGIDRTKDSASVFSKYLAKYLNYASGGTDYVAGGFSPTPDQIDYLIGQAAGGVGREALKLSQAAESAVTGETLPPYKVPLVGRFYGKATGSASVAAPFYENLDRMIRHRAEIDGRVDDGKPVDDYFKANPEARYAKEAVMAERAVRDNRRALREAVANGDKVRVKEIESRIEDIMTRFNAKVDEGKDYLENRRRVNEMFQ